MTTPPPASLAERIDAAIRPTMLLGLQDAELDGPGGTQRIGEWVDWIAARVAETLQPELYAAHAENERLRAVVAQAAALLPADPAEDINASWLPPRFLRAALDGGCTDCGGKNRIHPGHYPTCPTRTQPAT